MKSSRSRKKNKCQACLNTVCLSVWISFFIVTKYTAESWVCTSGRPGGILAARLRLNLYPGCAHLHVLYACAERRGWFAFMTHLQVNVAQVLSDERAETDAGQGLQKVLAPGQPPPKEIVSTDAEAVRVAFRSKCKDDKSFEESLCEA